MSQRPIHLPQERRIAPSKLTGYLLHPSNSQGKAAFFQRMGFSLENWPALQQALLMHAESATLIGVLAGHKGLLTLISPVRTFGLEPKRPIAALPILAGSPTQLRLAPCARPFGPPTHPVKSGLTGPMGTLHSQRSTADAHRTCAAPLADRRLDA
ncbi:DUF6883 domain-containing protein [Curvibacter gracilis]|uniref:DUF6883 domain-containing protein n=1 Tax=Curvibacter gracilis TaxID=230310 RepID=UPI003CCBE353